jgi:5-formyltetrahydrofolate cyclo-ligase
MNFMCNFISRLLIFIPGYSRQLIKRKNKIRQEIRLLNEKYKVEEKEREAGIVFEKIESLEQFKMASTILLYWSTKNEMPTHQFIEKWGGEKNILLPSVVGSEMVLKQYTKRMVQGLLGIWEPETEVQYIGEIELAIIPGVAFDRRKNRLGRGKGYYDRFLANKKCTKIGICFDYQLLASLPTNFADKKMDFIVTPSEFVS